MAQLTLSSYVNHKSSLIPFLIAKLFCIRSRTILTWSLTALSKQFVNTIVACDVINRCLSRSVTVSNQFLDTDANLAGGSSLASVWKGFPEINFVCRDNYQVPWNVQLHTMSAWLLNWMTFKRMVMLRPNTRSLAYKRSITVPDSSGRQCLHMASACK